MERRKGIGSSDTPAILGFDRYRTALHVYLDKKGELPEEPETEPQLWGRLLQEPIARMYDEREGTQIIRMFDFIERSKETPYLTASVDALAPPKIDGKKPKVVEIKSVAFESDSWGEPHTDQIPEGFLLQVQHQMYVMELDHADVATLFGTHNFCIYHIDRNERIIQQVIQRTGEFWDRVQAGDPPAPDWWHPATKPLLESLYDIEPGKVVDLGNEARLNVVAYINARSREKDFERQKTASRNALLHLLGDAECGILPDGTKLVRKRIEVAGHAVEPFAYTRLTVKPVKETA